MTIDEALAFADPKGDYAQYVALQNKGEVATPMGAYQIVGKTLRDAKNALKLDGGLKLTKNVQDKIGKWLFETQGTDAWVGYKGPRVKGKNTMVLPNNNSMNVYSMFRDQLQPQAPSGIMGYLQNPEVRRAFGNISRSSMGKRIAGLADKEIAEGKTKATRNTTIRYLMSQKDGRPYAEAILAGADARQTLKDYMTATGKTGGAANVRNQIELPNFAGSIVTLMDGTTYIETPFGEKITDKAEAEKYATDNHDALMKKEIPIYGDGMNVRDWLYVNDHCDAIKKIILNGDPGEVYNIGCSNEITNIDIAKTICTLLDSLVPLNGKKSYLDFIKFIKDRPGHDFRYAIDSSKIKKKLSWHAKTSFKDGISTTTKWYLENMFWFKENAGKDFDKWIDLQY